MIVYIDPSGDPDNPATTHFAIAGYAAQVEQWAEFEREWGAVLVANDLKRFHMKDCEFRHADKSLHHDYRHKTAEHWVEVKKTLAEIIERYTDSGIGVAHDLVAFRKIMQPPLTLLARGRPAHEAAMMLTMGDPLAVALQAVIHHVLEYCRPVIRPGEVLKVICDNEKSGPKGRLMQAYEDVRKLFQWEDVLNETLNFESSLRMMPLQAADMVAYEIRKSIENRDVLPPRRLFKLLLDERDEGGRIGVIHYREPQYRKLIHTMGRAYGIRLKSGVPRWVGYRYLLWSFGMRDEQLRDFLGQVGPSWPWPVLYQRFLRPLFAVPRAVFRLLRAFLRRRA